MPEEHFEAIYCLLRLIDNNAFSVTPFDTDVIFLLYFKYVKTYRLI